jgi:hypothetical protein
VADRKLLLLNALRRALAEPSGLPLHGGKSAAGLFPTTQPGKQATQRCLDEGLLRQHPADPQLYSLSETGLDWLLQQTSPREVLDDMVRALEARQAETAALVETARRMQATLEALRSRADQVLQYLPVGLPALPGDEAWRETVLTFLTERHAGGASEDCPLPELYRQARQVSEALSIGGFHDGLRQLHAGGRIYLHPWTGPLYALPEPPFALLIGHEIAYYASPRKVPA